MLFILLFVFFVVALYGCNLLFLERNNKIDQKISKQQEEIVSLKKRVDNFQIQQGFVVVTDDNKDELAAKFFFK